MKYYANSFETLLAQYRSRGTENPYLYLVADPNNPEDPYAVRLIDGTETVGYVSKQQSKEVWDALVSLSQRCGKEQMVVCKVDARRTPNTPRNEKSFKTNSVVKVNGDYAINAAYVYEFFETLNDMMPYLKKADECGVGIYVSDMEPVHVKTHQDCIDLWGDTSNLDELRFIIKEINDGGFIFCTQPFKNKALRDYLFCYGGEIEQLESTEYDDNSVLFYDYRDRASSRPELVELKAKVEKQLGQAIPNFFELGAIAFKQQWAKTKVGNKWLFMVASN